MVATLRPLTPADQTLLDDFYRRYFLITCAWVHRRVRAPIEPDDVISDVWLHVAAGIANGKYRDDGTGNPRPWLFTITHNRIVEAYRKRAIERERLNPVSLGEYDALEIPEPAKEQGVSAPIVDLPAAIAKAKLPDKTRRALELRLTGMSNRAAASVLNTTEGNVRALVHRGVTVLRRDLKGGSPVA